MKFALIAALVASCFSCASIQDPVITHTPYNVILGIPDQDGDGRGDILIISSEGHGSGGWVESQIRNCRLPFLTSVTVVSGGTNTDTVLLTAMWCAESQPRRMGIAKNNLDGTETFFIEDERLHFFPGVKLTTEQFNDVKRQLEGGA